MTNNCARGYVPEEIRSSLRQKHPSSIRRIEQLLVFGFQGKLLHAFLVNNALIEFSSCARSVEALSILEEAGNSEGSSRSHRVALIYLEQRCVEGTPSEGADEIIQVVAIRHGHSCDFDAHRRKRKIALDEHVGEMPPPYWSRCRGGGSCLLDNK